MHFRSLILLVCCSFGAGIILEVPVNERVCIGEFLEMNELVVGKFSFHDEPAHGKDMLMDVEVVDPVLTSVYTKFKTTDSGKFAFTTKTFGDYTFCFKNTPREGIAAQPDWFKSVVFEVKHGVDAKDYTKMVQTEHLSVLELQLRRMEDVVKSLHEEVIYMKTREHSMRNTTDSTHSRVVYFALFSITVLFCIGMWQLWHLKRFFQAKKLI